MYNDFNRPPRQYKKRSFVGNAVLYGILALLCFVIGAWPFGLIFLALTVFYVFVHKRNMDKIDSNLVRQGLYQIKQGKKNKKAFEKERKQSFQDYLRKIENDFEDTELDEELYSLEAEDKLDRELSSYDNELGDDE